MKNLREKQQKLNDWFDKQFMSDRKKEVQKHGIVHTPLEIVEFQIDSLDDTLKEEFAISIYDRDISINDDFLGTGTYIIIYLIKLFENKPENLDYKYENDIFCNEIVGDTYNIAKNNIEDCYFQLTGIKKQFKNIKNIDTFESY